MVINEYELDDLDQLIVGFLVEAAVYDAKHVGVIGYTAFWEIVKLDVSVSPGYYRTKLAMLSAFDIVRKHPKRQSYSIDVGAFKVLTSDPRNL